MHRLFVEHEDRVRAGKRNTPSEPYTPYGSINQGAMSSVVHPGYEDASGKQFDRHQDLC